MFTALALVMAVCAIVDIRESLEPSGFRSVYKFCMAGMYVLLAAMILNFGYGK